MFFRFSFFIFLFIFVSFAYGDVQNFWSKDLTGLTIASSSKIQEKVDEKKGAEAALIRSAVNELAKKDDGTLLKSVPSVNLATVKVYYETNSFHPDVKSYPMEQVFVSGWHPIRSHQRKIYHQLSDPKFSRYDIKALGDFYEVSTKEMGKEESKRSYGAQSRVNALKKDFENRGIDIKTDLEKGNFSYQTYAHSEQAFISCVLQDGTDCEIRGEKPTLVVLEITSKNPACAMCEKALKNIANKPTHREKFIKALFPSMTAREARATKVHILYISANRKPEERFDLDTDTPFFIDTRQ